ncbi:MAG: hypothetical protein IPJ43_14790 [Saprospiraceae bacterium]|nr:hypothetical protein [Saprospiraceae bacterium]
MKADENDAGVKIKTKQVLHIGIQNNPDTIISYLFENENSSFIKRILLYSPKLEMS